MPSSPSPPMLSLSGLYPMSLSSSTLPRVIPFTVCIPPLIALLKLIYLHFLGLNSIFSAHLSSKSASCRILEQPSTLSTIYCHVINKLTYHTSCTRIQVIKVHHKHQSSQHQLLFYTSGLGHPVKKNTILSPPLIGYANFGSTCPALTRSFGL